MMGQEPLPVVIITGPTASGKSALAYALADSLGGKAEFINADSFQVYRGLDLGTAKPGPEEQKKIPHHLLDILDPRDSCDLGMFMELARSCIAGVQSRGNLPIVCGGTVYYIKHLVQGMPEAPPSDPEVRRLLGQRLQLEGPLRLHEELLRMDPSSAARIHPNDAYRITRALEVFQVSGKPLSSFSRENSASDLDFRLFSLERPRQVLWDRIALRCKEMQSRGLEKEVRELHLRGLNPDHPGMKAIGYREFFRSEGSGWVFRSDMDKVFEEIFIHTRQYAKRQETFIRSLQACMPLNMDGASLEQVLSGISTVA